ncbi:MAG TPA: hypothetical protein VIK86_05690 [Candidatus Paceibacterota bacterium]
MGRPVENKDRENFTTTINRTILENIRLKAVKERKNINDIIEELFNEYLQ